MRRTYDLKVCTPFCMRDIINVLAKNLLVM